MIMVRASLSPFICLYRGSGLLNPLVGFDYFVEFGRFSDGNP